MGREISRTPQVRSSRRLRRAAVGQGEAVAASVASGVGFIEWFGGASLAKRVNNDLKSPLINGLKSPLIIG